MLRRILVHIDPTARVMEWIDSAERTIAEVLKGAFDPTKKVPLYQMIYPLWALVHALYPDGKQWVLKIADCPKQERFSNDCGVIACAKAFYFLHDVVPFPLYFGFQNNTNRFRKYLAELLIAVGKLRGVWSELVEPKFAFEAVVPPPEPVAVPAVRIVPVTASVPKKRNTRRRNR